MVKKILVLGATGMLGLPVANHLLERGKQVRVLARHREKAKQMLGEKVEIIEGNASNREDIRKAVKGCNAVHLSLPQEVEFAAMQHVIEFGTGLERITYISATTAFEANRWFDLIDTKLRTEEILCASGIANTIFCPTWAMETLKNFVHENRAFIILSSNPPGIHFLAAGDLGKMVAASYEDTRAVGKKLFIHGPEKMQLPDALKHFINSCYPKEKIMQMKLWQAQLLANLGNRKKLKEATKLIAYFDKVGELGDPSEANSLLGAPNTTLEKWIERQKS